MTRTWAVVPFKGPGGKRRLAPLLDEDERYALARAMLADVLDALLASDGLKGILLVTPDDDATREVAHDRVQRLAEPVAGGLNGALALAQAAAVNGGVARLLVVPADVPLLGPDDVGAVVRAGDALGVGRYAVIAPNTARTGTNALLLCPPDFIDPRFGADSFAAHRKAVAALGVTIAEVARPGLALDVDRPENLAAVLAADPQRRTVELLGALDIGRRLSAAVTPRG